MKRSYKCNSCERNCVMTVEEKLYAEKPPYCPYDSWGFNLTNKNWVVAKKRKKRSEYRNRSVPKVQI